MKKKIYNLFFLFLQSNKVLINMSMLIHLLLYFLMIYK